MNAFNSERMTAWSSPGHVIDSHVVSACVPLARTEQSSTPTPECLIRGSKSRLAVFTFELTYLCARSGMGVQGEGQHPGGSEESPTNPVRQAG